MKLGGANTTLWLVVVAMALSTASTRAQEACCFSDRDTCRYLSPEECTSQGGTPQGPPTDCSWGICCLGPCCLPGGSCALLPFQECVVDHDGQWRGPGMTCETAWCGDLEACCYIGGCIDAPRDACEELAGTPQGFGSTCAGGACPPQTQACCHPDATCADVDTNNPSAMSACLMEGGMLMGPGSTCQGIFCWPTQPCCFRDFAEQFCMNQNPTVCEMSGGWPLGPWTTCATTIMCGTGVCCLPDGSCRQLSESGCTAEGGFFCGNGTYCTETTCELQACCFAGEACAGGYCDYVPACRCLYRGGAPLGPAADCATWPCGQQACCKPDGSCTNLATIDCLDEGGLAQGSGTDCSRMTCEEFRGGACCISSTECLITTEEEACTADLGGTFLGFDTGCPTQVVEHFSEEGQEGVFNHVILKIVDCPGPEERGGLPCVPSSGPKLDLWTSPGGGAMCQIFGVPDSPAIPAGYFDSGSDSFTGLLCLKGVPLGTVELEGFGKVDVGDADTVIFREADPFDRCTLPSDTPVNVGIRIAALNLESIAPIMVMYNGGQTPQQWSATVDLSEVHTDGDPDNDPPLGTLTAKREHCNGGTYTNVLRVQPRFTFTKVGHPEVTRVLDTGLEGIPPVTLGVSTSPAGWVLDVHSSLETPNPVCTHFHPGFEEEHPPTECDCNTNDVRDKCDIESGYSRDCNNNNVPDSCDLTAGTSHDCNETGVPDECEDLGGGDFTFDGNIALDDLSSFVECASAPGVGPIPGVPDCARTCLRAFDSDADADVDLRDFAVFQVAFGGRR